ncbi:unnamed protein product [Staurois parvus]|uniref:Uncharacterized protein n=1 Tax=Staurois parvus TaxID=386267 RepID=A0ABN9E352_9NEOB|nr:unnamed protein product [Staurois parvus]
MLLIRRRVAAVMQMHLKLKNAVEEIFPKKLLRSCVIGSMSIATMLIHQRWRRTPCPIRLNSPYCRYAIGLLTLEDALYMTYSARMEKILLSIQSLVREQEIRKHYMCSATSNGCMWSATANGCMWSATANGSLWSAATNACMWSAATNAYGYPTNDPYRDPSAYTS